MENTSVSTIDRGIQTQIEELQPNDGATNSNRSDIRNLAILVIDIRTNQVVAYCGNVHFERKQAGNQVDVIQAPRSTGSILKPFLYYAMLQEGSLLPDTLLPDIPVNINGFTPQNFSLQFEGAVPASEALARSLNIPAVTMLQRYGVPKFHSFPETNRAKNHQPSVFPLWFITHSGRSRSHLMGCDKCVCYTWDGVYCSFHKQNVACCLRTPQDQGIRSLRSGIDGYFSIGSRMADLRCVNRSESSRRNRLEIHSFHAHHCLENRNKLRIPGCLGGGCHPSLCSRCMGRKCYRRRKTRAGRCTDSRPGSVRCI